MTEEKCTRGTLSEVRWATYKRIRDQTVGNMNRFGHDPHMSIQAATHMQFQSGGGGSGVPRPLTIKLTPGPSALIVKPPVPQLLEKFPKFNGNRRLSTVFTKSRHSSLPWARSVQFILPYSLSIRSILTLSSQQCLDFPNGLFHSGVLTKNVSPFVFTPFGLHALPTPPSLTWAFRHYLKKSTWYEVPHYAIFFQKPIISSVVIPDNLNSCVTEKQTEKLRFPI
jgi:hypothetical protein